MGVAPTRKHHLTLTSSHWMNAVGRLFAQLRQAACSAVILQAFVDATPPYLRAHNRNGARPFVWLRDPAEFIAILGKGQH